MSPWFQRLLLGLLWLSLLLAALVLRPLLPVDETRYVSVAWEMWNRGDFCLPLLNGEPYSHKPPLLFWLIQAGWGLFGVNNWWPRLVIPLVSLLNLGLTVALLRQWWPEEVLAARLAPWLLFGGLMWSGFYSLVQFDHLLVTAVLVSMLGLVRAYRGQPGGWWLLGLGIGLGALAKGPVILLHIMPVALLAPWWARSVRPGSWWGWYRGILFSLLLGVAIGLAWAIPAALAGGETYAKAIAWGQHAGRMGGQADHAQPFWWYLPLLPLMWLPWILWPRIWRALAALPLNDGVRFCLAWWLPVLLLFSLVGGKQGKYLLPMFPALALLMAYGLSRWHRAGVPVASQGERLWGPAMLALLAGAVLLAAPHLPLDVRWLPGVQAHWGWVLLLLGILLLGLRVTTLEASVRRIALLSVVFWLVVHISVLRAMAPSVDLQPLSQRLAMLQQQGYPIGITQEYAGQFHWLGRLQSPLKEFYSEVDFAAWLKPGTESYVIVHEVEWRETFPHAEFVQPYRSGAFVLLKTSALVSYRKAMDPSDHGPAPGRP